MWPLLKQTAWKWYGDKAIKLSAALALYAVLSLAPMLIISLKGLSFIFGAEVASEQVQRQMQNLIGPAGAEAIQEILEEAANPESGKLATLISIIILFFTASGVFGELQDSLNTIWNVKPRPDISWWETIRDRFLSMAMVFVILFLLLVSMFVSTLLTTVAHRIAGEAAPAAIITDMLVSILVVSLLITMLYRFLPDVRIDWRDVFLGALVTAVLFEMGQYLLGLYFRYGSTTSAYGAAGSFVAVLLWIYYSGWIFFFGAEFTAVYAKSRGRGFEPTEHAVALTYEDRASHGISPSPNRLAELEPSRPHETPYHPV